MTTIWLSDTVKVTVDSFNHTLLRFVPGGGEIVYKGKIMLKKDSWETLGYYPNLEWAVRDLVTKYTDYGDARGIEEYTDRIVSEISNITTYISDIGAKSNV